MRLVTRLTPRIFWSTGDLPALQRLTAAERRALMQQYKSRLLRHWVIPFLDAPFPIAFARDKNGGFVEEEFEPGE